MQYMIPILPELQSGKAEHTLQHTILECCTDIIYVPLEHPTKQDQFPLMNLEMPIDLVYSQNID
jgi:hypothetical protein